MAEMMSQLEVASAGEMAASWNIKARSQAA